MADYDTVLIPTDGSDPAERGIDHGLDIAADSGATTHFMYVIDETRYGERPGVDDYEVALEEIRNEAIAELERLQRAAEERGLDAETYCTRGTPYDEITDYADDIDADIIVMGKRGEGSAEPPHVGRVADRVLRTADMPVFPV